MYNSIYVQAHLTRIFHQLLRVGICGLSQPKVWYDKFDPDANIDTGLSGRFLLAESDVYELELPELNMTEAESFREIQGIFCDLLAKTRGLGNTVADRVRCEVPETGEDERGRILDEIMAAPNLAAVKKHGFMDVEKLKGKLIMLALKLTVGHCYMNAEIPWLRTLTGEVIDTGVVPDESSVNPHSLNPTEGEDVVEVRRATVDCLYDTEAYRQYLYIVILAAVRAYNANAVNQGVVSAQARVLKRLKKVGGGKLFMSKINEMGLKMDGHRMRPQDIMAWVLQPLAEQGVIAIEEGKRGGYTIRWTGSELVL